MQGFIDFIRKYHFVILFIVLEVISVLLLANSQNYHKQAMVNSTNDVVGKVYDWGSSVGNYFRMGKINEQLAEENARLRQQLAIAIDTLENKYSIYDRDTVYEYISARVVNNSIHQANNYIIIDKGRVDGIKPDMSVISSEGIVGVVKDVSRHYASVISLLHGNSLISIRFKSSQELGTLKWNGSNYRFGIVEDIPTHLKLQQGDTIVTGPYSYIFPEDLMVGTVEELYETQSGALNSAKIRFATNFATLRQVYIINNLHSSELDSLKSKF